MRKILHNNPAYLYPEEMKSTAYSYLRFSTPEQALGDSERRQIDQAEEWAKKKGLALETGFRDRGTSGFKGVNRRKGALAEFLRQVDQGEILRGSYLVVEDLDRLSREHPVDSLGLVHTLLHAGIIIVVLKTGDEYSVSSLRADSSGIKMMGLTFELGRASGESDRKARLSKANWDQKLSQAIAKGNVLTAQTPAWVKVVKDTEGVKKFVLDEDRASIVRDIFKWTIGGLGARTIAKKLNEAKVENWGKGKRIATHWHNSYIQKIIHSRTVLGEFQPHEYAWVEDKDGRTQVRVPRGEPLKNYYPPVVDEATFMRAAEAKNNHKHYGGRLNMKVGNLLSGLVFARVFDPLLREKQPQGKFHDWTDLVKCHYRNKGKVREIYYISNVDPLNKKRAKKDQIKSQSFPVFAVEYAILKRFSEINWSELSQTSSLSFMDEREQCKRLWEVVEESKRKVDRYLKALGDEDDEGLLRRYKEAQRDRKELLAKAEKKQAELDSKVTISDEDICQPMTIPESAYDPFDRENRLLLRAEIARRVEKIELASTPAQPKHMMINVIFRNGAKRLIVAKLRKNDVPEIASATIQLPASLLTR